MKTPNTTEHDLRCKGTKDDLELAREWINQDNGRIIYNFSDGSKPLKWAEGKTNKQEAIEKELGKERLEFLVFKIETEERLAKLEKLEKAKVKTECDSADHSNDDFFVTGVNTQDGSLVGRFTKRNTWHPWYKRLLDSCHKFGSIDFCLKFLAYFALLVLLPFAAFVIYQVVTHPLQ